MRAIVQVGDYGPKWELRSPHTLESVRDRVALYQEHGRRGLCAIRHRWEEIGVPYFPPFPDEEDENYHRGLMNAAISVLVNLDYETLLLCKRCGMMAQRRRR